MPNPLPIERLWTPPLMNNWLEILKLLSLVRKLDSIKAPTKSQRASLISTELKESETLQLLKLVLRGLLLEPRSWDSSPLLNTWHGTSPFKLSTISSTVVLKLHTWVQAFSVEESYSEDSTVQQLQLLPSILNVSQPGMPTFRAWLPFHHTTLKTTEAFWKQPSDQTKLLYFWKIKTFMVRNSTFLMRL